MQVYKKYPLTLSPLIYLHLTLTLFFLTLTNISLLFVIARHHLRPILPIPDNLIALRINFLLRTLNPRLNVLPLYLEVLFLKLGEHPVRNIDELCLLLGLAWVSLLLFGHKSNSDNRSVFSDHY